MQMIDVCTKEAMVKEMQQSIIQPLIEPVKDFDDVRSFDDVRQANLNYLRGHVSYTPVHFGPLATETDVLKNWLIRLCEHFPVVTLESQPPMNDGRQKQRAFVEALVWQPSPVRFVELLASRLDRRKLEYNIVCSGGECFMSQMFLEHDLVVATHTGKKRTDGSCDCTLFAQYNLSEELGNFDTDAYALSEDKNVISIQVIDPVWNGPDPNGVLKAVYSAMRGATQRMNVWEATTQHRLPRR